MKYMNDCVGIELMKFQIPPDNGGPLGRVSRVAVYPWWLYTRACIATYEFRVQQDKWGASPPMMILHFKGLQNVCMKRIPTLVCLLCFPFCFLSFSLLSFFLFSCCPSALTVAPRLPFVLSDTFRFRRLDSDRQKYHIIAVGCNALSMPSRRNSASTASVRASPSTSMKSVAILIQGPKFET